MEPKDIGLILLGLLNFGWLAFSQMKKGRDENTSVKITDRADFMKDMAAALEKATLAKERLETASADAQKTTNRLEYENAIYKNKIELLEAVINSFREDVKKLSAENKSFREENEAFREIESELKSEVYELRKSNQEFVRMYESALAEKERKLKDLTETSKRQGIAIEKLKNILSDNGLTANIEL